MRLLVGDDTDGVPADARIAAEHGLAILGPILVKLAAIDDARDDFLRVVLARWVVIEDAVNFFRRIERLAQGLAVKDAELAISHLVDERANAHEAAIVVGLAKIDCAADLRVHLRAAQLFRGIFRPDGGLHQRGSRKKQATAFGHEDVVAHDRQIRSTGDAHAHDGGDLRDSHGRHDGVVAKDATEVVGVGKNIFLQRQEHARRIDEINRGNAVIDGDVLCANDFLGSNREERTRFDRGVVHDEHDQPAFDARETGHDTRAWRAAPLFIHAPCRVGAEFEEHSARIDKSCDALAGGETCFLVLRLNGLGAAALLDLLFVHPHAGDEFGDSMLVALKARRSRFDLGFQLQGRSGVLVFAHVERSRTLGQTDNDKAAERVDATRERLVHHRDTQAQRK